MTPTDINNEDAFKKNLYPILLGILAFVAVLGINLMIGELRDISKSQATQMDFIRENATNIRLIQRDLQELREDSIKLQSELEALKKTIRGEY